MEGVLLQDHAHEVDRILERLGRLVSEGVLRSHEFVLDGLDAAPGAVRLLYDGGNLGKMLIRLEQPAIPDRVHR
jgi:NADPH-dependent curcumin reductase CurA